MKYKTKITRALLSVTLTAAMFIPVVSNFAVSAGSLTPYVFIDESFDDADIFPDGQAPDFADWGAGDVKTNKWNNTVSGFGTVEVITANGRRITEIDGQSGPAELSLDFSDEPLSGIIEIEAVINLKSRSSGSPCLFEIWDTSAAKNKLLSVNNNTSSNIQFNNGAWTSLITNNVIGTFHTYKFKIDTEAKTNEITVDGVSKGTHSLRNAALFNGEIGSVSMYGDSKNTGVIQLDSIKITKYELTGLNPPENLTADKVTTNSVSLIWNAVDGAASYDVYKDGEFSASVAETAFADFGLSKDTSYVYSVIAKNSKLDSDPARLSVRTLYAEGAETVAEESFDSYPIGKFNSNGPWTILNSGGGIADVKGIPDGEDKSLVLEIPNNYNGDKADAEISFPPIEGNKKVIIDMDMMVDGSGNKFSCSPYINDINNNQILKFGFRDGNFSAFNNTDNADKTQDIMSYQGGRWYNVRLVYHTDRNYYSLFVDGKRMDSVNGYDVRMPDAEIASLMFRTDNAAAKASNYINNLRVVTVPTAPIVDIEFGRPSYLIYENEIYTPDVRLIDSDGDRITTTENLTFSSSAPEILQIDPVTGALKALASEGSAEITVKNSSEGKSMSRTVKVTISDGSEIPVPENLSAPVIRNYSVELLWDDAGGDVSKYFIYRSDSEAGPFNYIGASKPEATREDSATRYIDNNTEPDTTYYYKIASTATSMSGNTVTSKLSDVLKVTTAPKSKNVPAKQYTVRDEFNEDETNQPPAGYEISGGAAMVKELNFAEDKCVRVEAGARASKTIFPVTGIVTVENKFCVSGTSNTRSVPELYNSNGQMLARVRTNNANFEYLNSSGTYTQINGLTISPNVWYIVRVVADTYNKTYDIYIDGQKRVSNVGFPITADETANIARIDFYSTLNALYFDNVKLYTHIDYIGVPTGEVINVKTYGAAGDGKTNDREAIQKAIDRCPSGGTVLLEDGVFYTGSIMLKSNMTLYINHDATLLGSSSTADYPYYDPMTYSTQLGPRHNCSRALIYAENVENVKIDGGGTISGNGKYNFTENVRGVSNEPHRPIAIYIAMSNTVTIQNVYVRDSAMWTIVPAESDYVTVRNIFMDCRANANRDGIDIVDCKNVLVEDCTVTTADDALCIKSGKRRGVDNLLMQNSNVTVCYTNGIKFGTASYGAFKNCYFRDIMMKNIKYSPMCIESVDGADIDSIYFDRIDFHDVTNPFWIILGQRSLRGTGTDERGSMVLGDDFGKVGTLQNIFFKNIRGRNLSLPSTDHPNADGSPISGTTVTGEDGKVYEYRVKNIYFENVDITYKGNYKNGVPNTPPEYKLGQYPESSIWGYLPSWAYFIRHADNVVFKDCITGLQNSDSRAPFAWVDASGRVCSSVTFDSNGGSEVEQQLVDEGQKAARPASPTKSGFIFDGWYADKELTQLYDFGSEVNAKTTLYAKWAPAPTTEPTTTEEVEFRMLGDIDENGIINIKDATAIQMSLADLIELTPLQKAVGDVFGSDSYYDGDITIKDATEIQMWLASLPANQDIGKKIIDPNHFG